MANYYYSSSFLLPASWPEEAKKLFYNLVIGLYEAESEEELEKVFLDNDVHESKEEISYLYENHARLDSEVYEGKYYFWNLEDFNEDVTKDLLDIVTERFKIPYEERIEVSYCWGCDKPRPGDFGGARFESYYNPKKQ